MNDMAEDIEKNTSNRVIKAWTFTRALLGFVGIVAILANIYFGIKLGPILLTLDKVVNDVKANEERIMYVEEDYRYLKMEIKESLESIDGKILDIYKILIK